MKILIAAGPRTGSHAFCQIQPVKNNLFEIMNIEDCILPRLENNTIDFSICSKEFLCAIDDREWEKAWNLKPALSDLHHVLIIDNNLNKVYSSVYPTLDELLNEYQTRWEIIKKLDDWCIKVIQYQGIPEPILNEMIELSDKFYILNRRNKIEQALSITKSTQTQQWHGTVDNPIISDAGDIDYNIFLKSCGSVRSDDAWLHNRFIEHNPEYVYYEDLNLSDSNFIKNHISLKYDITLCERYWALSDTTTIDNWFKEFINTYNWEPLQKIRPNNTYFKMITDQSVDDLNYWNLHITALKSIGIDNMSRDIAWLDIGIWFGIMPFVMKQNGFVNIETTDCAVHRIELNEFLNQLWLHFDLQPKELEIRPQVKFKLDKTYDLITIMKSNVFWKTDEVIHYDGTNVEVAWQNKGADNKSHTYFTVYNKEDWEFFVENIKEFLNPGGVAVVNPEPWVYDKIASCEPARDYLKQFQSDIIATGQPYSNYLIIRK